jgi:phosphoribosyl 1,2-cyclic phosphodiesterase
MYIKCWGSRGSIPVSGLEYIKYGGDTTCLEIRSKNGDIIIVDAGTGVRRLGNHLMAENRHTYHFIFTHAHWDHLMGFPFFKPLYSAGSKIHVHRCPFPSKYVEKMIHKVMAPPNFPVKYRDLKARILYAEGCPTHFNIGSVEIVPIALSHPNSGSGYKFIEDGKNFVFLTDNELSFTHSGGLSRRDYIDFCAGTDLLLHDAEYTPEEYKKKREWGHSEYREVLELAFAAGVEKIGLFHLHQERTDAEMDQIVRNCRGIISQKHQRAECFAVGCDMEFEL